MTYACISVYKGKTKYKSIISKIHVPGLRTLLTIL